LVSKGKKIIMIVVLAISLGVVASIPQALNPPKVKHYYTITFYLYATDGQDNEINITTQNTIIYFENHTEITSSNGTAFIFNLTKLVEDPDFKAFEVICIADTEYGLTATDVWFDIIEDTSVTGNYHMDYIINLIGGERRYFDAVFRIAPRGE